MALWISICPTSNFWDSKFALKYPAAKNYPEEARRAVKEMHRQVGDLMFDEEGLALRGVLFRHLVMPGSVAGTREITKVVAREISPYLHKCHGTIFSGRKRVG